MARAAGMDLVEISATSRPPVCRIMDYGKFKYEQSKRARKAKKNQHIQRMKEVKLRPKIEEHDYLFKVKHAREFLEERDKVKLSCQFRGREMAHQDLGMKVLQRAIQDLSDLATVELAPRMEGRILQLVMIPKPGLKPRTPRSSESAEQVEDSGAPGAPSEA